MIEIRDKEYCCGCGACAQKCPLHSIEMVEDREGFLYPQCNNELCINCGQCEDVCPVINKSVEADRLKGSYVCYSCDDVIRADSSSGGLFSLLAAEILEDDGVVYGAAFDTDYTVHHIRIDHIDQIYTIQRSKYLQSRIEETYAKAKKDLKDGRRVLFSGTACQIEGLKKYLGREYDRLLTVDILCHGTPSPMIWKLYLRSLNENYPNGIKDINFRNKEFGWKNYSLKISYDKGDYYTASHYKDVYMNLFLSDVILRPSCYNCQFKDINRVSDITLGDAWGINKILPIMDDDRGTSLLLVHTEKGAEYVEKLNGKIHIELIELNQILPRGADSRVSVKKHPKREEFFERVWKYDTMAFNWWDGYRKRKRLKEKLAGKIRSVFTKTRGVLK